ncbi:MAG: CinA family nicotinamide mononucleotide deamidase-related protein [Muribaculaceae bacterium]|nr:CinA family nicotinamide mononucleotide deamidase-related protein [Muribaculaceae bacterium]MDE6610222.1 CinA family nicotinamide mononucleotide deamidase-related protein [Muribaculaceae bacterium]
MKVSIIVIGDELLIGQVTDTNSGFLARTMRPAGWTVVNVDVVPDDNDRIRHAVAAALERADVVLTTGGLGPTKDDITKQALMDVFGGELYRDEAVEANVREVVGKRGIRLNSLTADQALVPTSCRVIQNRLGTAPIMVFERDGKTLVAMPGVPFETRGMFTSEVFPMLMSRYAPDINLRSDVVQAVGITESDLAIRLSSWEESLPTFLHLAYLPQPGLIRLRLDGSHTDRAMLDVEMNRRRAELITLVGDNLFAEKDITPAAYLVELLGERGLKVATAESCTGGSVSAAITSVPGASAVMQGAVVSYSNDVKTGVLGIAPEAIAAEGAVSAPVVEQMAAGVARLCGADCAIATSGVAGPGGGTPDKPVGTVWICILTPAGKLSWCSHFPGDRARVVDRTVMTSLVKLCTAIKKL